MAWLIVEPVVHNRWTGKSPNPGVLQEKRWEEFLNRCIDFSLSGLLIGFLAGSILSGNRWSHIFTV